jgi:hypothetical protein
LAEVAGYAFLTNSGGQLVTAIDWGHIPERCLEGDWDGVEPPKDPLIYLIAHSDCDGVIRPAQAALLADRIAELIPLLPPGAGSGHIGDWRETTQAFVDGLRAAAAAGEDVDFH